MPEKEWHELTGRAKYPAYLESSLWRAKRRAIKEYYHYRCAYCHRSQYDSVIIQVHHKHYDTLYHEKPNDLEVVCNQCHAEIHGMAVLGRSQKLGVLLKPIEQYVRKMTGDD